MEICVLCCIYIKCAYSGFDLMLSSHAMCAIAFGCQLHMLENSSSFALSFRDLKLFVYLWQTNILFNILTFFCTRYSRSCLWEDFPFCCRGIYVQNTNVAMVTSPISLKCRVCHLVVDRLGFWLRLTENTLLAAHPVLLLKMGPPFRK